MRSKKRTIGILILVIVILFGFACSLLIYRNKLSSENTKNDSDVYVTVGKEIYKKVASDTFKNASLEERKKIAIKLLNTLESKNLIKKGSIEFNEEYNAYFFEYIDGGEGSIMLGDFSSALWTAEKNISDNIDVAYKPSNNIDNSLNDTAKGYIKSTLSNNNLTHKINNHSLKKTALIIDEADTDALRSTYENYKEIWSSNGLETTIKSNVTVEEFKTILNGYDFIDINAHGYIVKNGNPTVCIQETLKFSDIKKYWQDIKENRVGTIYGVFGGNFYLTSDFFSFYYSKKLNDTIIWLSCCKGYSNDTLVGTFANECGVKSVIGATDNVWIDYDTDMTDIFVHKLLLGHTVDNALREAKLHFGKDGIDFAISKGWSLNEGPAEFKNYNGGKETLVKLVSIDTNGTLSGKVTDENNKPVKGAEIGIHNVQGNSYGIIATTNENGEYSLECPQDSYKIGVKADGYEIFETDDFIEVDYGKETVFNMTLKKDKKVTEPTKKSDNKIGEVKIEDGYLNVRDKPSTKGKLIGKLYNGDRVTIEESSADGKWLKITKGDIKGYVSKEYIKFIENKSDNAFIEKAEESDSGKCGDNLTWTLDSNGQLTIEGTGEMYNYYTPYNKKENSSPWHSHKIKSVVIKSGVTSIGNGAFGWQDYLENVSIANTVTSIGVYSFFSCDRLGYLFQIPESVTFIGKGAFDLCCNTRLLYVGKNVTNIEDYSFDNTYLLTIYGYNNTEAQTYAQNNNISFVCVDDDYGYHGTISNQNGASFRSGSSEKSKEISIIPYGTEVSEYDSIGDWALIKYNGTLGYVYKDDLLFEGGFAKPVIYLYPEKKQDVSVKVNFKNGDFTCTYPEYNNGWNVIAYPDGKIINKADNDEYSYLYWEGEGKIDYDFSSGFVVKKEDTAKFLKEKLSYMGLSPKEYNEFIVYWLPIMQKNEYNLISFQTDNYEESAKLEIYPKPDSILRVFMAFKEVTSDTVIPEQKIEPFKRNGFTVIEWGGTEVN